MVDNLSSVGVLRCSKNLVDARDKKLRHRANFDCLTGALVEAKFASVFLCTSPASLRSARSESGIKVGNAPLDRPAGAPFGINIFDRGSLKCSFVGRIVSGSNLPASALDGARHRVDVFSIQSSRQKVGRIIYHVLITS